MKKLLSFILALCMVLALALGTASAETVNVTFWHSITNSTIYAAFEEVINGFNNGIGAEKGIHIETVQYPSGTVLDQAVTGAIMSHTAPDIVMGNAIYMAAYVSADALVNLTPFIEGENGLDVSDIYPCWLRACNSYDDEGSFYCLPFQAQSEVVYYNVDFFEKNGLTIPTNWTEMEAVCRQIKDITGGMAGVGWDNAAKMFTTLVEQAGIGYTTAQGDILFGGDNLDKTVEAVEWYINLVREGVFRTPGESKYFSGPFANQNIYMYIGSGVEGAYIDQKIDPANPFKWGTFGVPQTEGGQPAVFSESSLISIIGQDNTAEVQQAAWEFIKYFESTDSMRTLTSVGSYLPVLKSVAEDPAWLEIASVSQKTGAAQMDSYYGFYAYDTGDYTSNTLYVDLRAAMENVLDNGADLNDTLEELLEEFDF